MFLDEMAKVQGFGLLTCLKILKLVATLGCCVLVEWKLNLYRFYEYSKFPSRVMEIHIV